VRKLIMLDFDGVIADSLEATCKAAIAVIRDQGYAHLASRKLILEVVESNWFEGLRRAGLPLAVSDAIDDLIADSALAGGLKPFAAMPNVITRLAECDPVLIVTSNRSDIVERLLTQWGIVGVSEVLGGEKETSKVRKIRAALSAYPQIESSWFVGDTVGDILEGRRAGVCTIAATWGWHAAEQLKDALPDRVANAPRDLLTFLL
jgi:phosphoglycolate phosphatase